MSDVARIREVFNEAIEVRDPARAAYLDEACAGDATLRVRVQELLAAAEREDAFLASPTGHPGASTPAGTLHEAPGTVIDRYKLLQQIGEGGFGVVFLAEQREPVQRKVALKIIKLGMDTRQVVARFEQERQALALMDHPNIARVLDAGATDSGRPYFVMELVRGDPITQYCDTNNLSVEERLKLFGDVCHAVQHAHQKGIIHRDIKPSNVLITVADGKPIPKVIDFGIAKATNARLTEKTLFTEHRALIGTPEYMSPEQAEMSGVDIDTRSDIYSLGVLLYELLTGALPFDPQRLRSAAFNEIQRIIREEEPPNPSTRLSTLKSTLPEVAAHRRTEPRNLSSSLRGDLDWIVMRALDKDRTRRYETANNLAADVQRHLDGEPVLAAPPSAAYRMRKFVRRHRVGVAAGTAIAAALVLGIAGTTAGFLNARRAESAERQRADELKQVSDFQAEMLSQVDPTEAGRLLTQDVTARLEAALAKAGVPEAERAEQIDGFGDQWRRVNATDAARDLIERTILRPAVEAIDKQFKDQPLVDAQLRQVLADRYVHLGLYDAATPLQEAALATRRRILGEDHKDTLDSMCTLGYLLMIRGRPAEAEPVFREAMDRCRRVFGEDHTETIPTINNMGFVLQALDRNAEAAVYFREALERNRRVLGEDHLDTLTAFANLGAALEAQGKAAEAEPYFCQALERRRRVLGDEHPATLNAVGNMGFLLTRQGRHEEAEPYCREAVEKGRRVLGEEHPQTLAWVVTLESLLRAQGNLIEAERYGREAVELSRRILGEDHPDTLHSINNVAVVLQLQGKLADAEPYAREIVTKSTRILGDSHPNTLISILNLAGLLEAQDKLAEAEHYCRKGLAAWRSVPTTEPVVLADSLFLLSLVLLKADTSSKAAQAEPLARECMQILLAEFPAGHPQAHRGFNAMSLLGAALFGIARDPAIAHGARVEKLREAELLLLDAYSGLENDPLVPPPERARGVDFKRRALERIVRLYETWSSIEPGKGYEDKAEEWRKRLEAGT